MALRNIVSQLGFTVELVAACLIFMLPLRKRQHFPVRLTVALLVNIAVSILLPPGSRSIPVTILRFGARYLAALGMVGFCLNVSLTDAFYCSICGYAAQHMASSLCFLLGALLHNHAISMTWYHPFQLLVLCLIYGLAWFFAARRMPDNGEYRISKGTAINAGLLILSITLGLNTYAGVQYANEDSGAVFNLHIACVVYDILCCLFIMGVQTSRQRESKAQRELLMLYKQKEQYALSSETIRIINQRCHDMKHQVAALEHMHGTDEERAAYIQELQQSLDVYDSSLNTGNEALDTVLMEKLLLCHQEQIQMTCMADGTALSFLSAVDLYTLFGNAIDNAMESVRQMENVEERLISVSVSKIKGMVLIIFENNFVHRPVFEEGVLITTKEDKQFHGFGVKSIRQIAEKYDGYVHIDTDHGVFTLQITIPIGE